MPFAEEINSYQPHKVIYVRGYFLQIQIHNSSNMMAVMNFATICGIHTQSHYVFIKQANINTVFDK